MMQKILSTTVSIFYMIVLSSRLPLVESFAAPRTAVTTQHGRRSFRLLSESSSSSLSSLAAPNTTTATSSTKRVALRGLLGDGDGDASLSSFRHPLDRDLTAALQSAPFLQPHSLANKGLRQVLQVVEQGLRLDLLSSSVKVSSQQLPELHEALVEACQILDMTTSPLPELYIQSSSTANAYTLALLGASQPSSSLSSSSRSPIIVVTSALVDRCTIPELQAILGHELGHLKCEHSVYLTLGQVAAAPWRNLPLVGRQSQDLLERWRLAAEYTCDRAALLVAQDVRIVNGAMVKLFAGTSRYHMNVDAFVDQCLEYDQLLAHANPLVRASIAMQNSGRTHPLPIRRVAELQKWSQSMEYQQILANKGVPLMKDKQLQQQQQQQQQDNAAASTAAPAKQEKEEHDPNVALQK